MLGHFEALYIFGATSYSSSTSLNFGILVGFIISNRNTDIFVTHLKVKKNFEDIGRSLCFRTIFSRATPFLSLRKMRIIDKLLWEQECCKRELESSVTFKNYSRTFLATKMLIDCSFLTKNCSSGSSEFTNVSS